MNGSYLLDTNIVIALFAEDNNVIDRIKQANEVYLPSIVMGELYYGAFKSRKKETNTQKIDDLRLAVTVLSCDDSTAKFYGEIKALLRKKGTPIPENDLWIAATALQYNLTLVARDSHFDNIEGLVSIKW